MTSLQEQLAGILNELKVTPSQLLSQRFTKDSIHLVPDQYTIRANAVRQISKRNSSRTHPRFLLENIDITKPCIESLDVHSIEENEVIKPDIEHFLIDKDAFDYPANFGKSRNRIIYSNVITAIVSGRIREMQNGREVWLEFRLCEWRDTMAKQQCSKWVETVLNRDNRITAIRNNLPGGAL